MPSNGRNSIRVDGRSVLLPGIGRVRMREEVRFDGDILGITISRTADRWFASFTVDTGEPAPNPKSGPDIGIDMGVTTLAVLWDGQRKTLIANPKALEHARADLRATQKAIARSIKVNGRPRTRRRRRLHEKPAGQHARVARIRWDPHHEATAQIAKRGGRVTVETLNVDGMKRTTEGWPGRSAMPACPNSCGSWSTSTAGTARSSGAWTAGIRRRRRAVHAEP